MIEVFWKFLIGFDEGSSADGTYLLENVADLYVLETGFKGCIVYGKGVFC